MGASLNTTAETKNSLGHEVSWTDGSFVGSFVDRSFVDRRT
jgi:hypothetical protein